jgi:hypothetical protein
LEATPLGSLIQELVINEVGFEGTFKSLLESLRANDPNSKLPTSPKALADKLRRLAPALRESGFQIEFPEERKEDGYHVAISKTFKTSTASTEKNDNTDSIPELPELHVPNPNLFEKNNSESIGNVELF